MLLHQPSPNGSSIVARMIKNARRYEHTHSLSAHRGDSSSGEITGRVRNVRTRGHRGRCPSNSFRVATRDINHIEISYPQPGGAPASVPITSTRHIYRTKHSYPWAPGPVPLQLNSPQRYWRVPLGARVVHKMYKSYGRPAPPPSGPTRPPPSRPSMIIPRPPPFVPLPKIC
jgi:hypothetical protein